MADTCAVSAILHRASHWHTKIIYKNRKMEISNSIVVVITLASVIIPVLLIMRSVSKKKKELSDRVNTLKTQYQLVFSDSDAWDNIVLGMDKAAGKLLWFMAGKTPDEHILVDLREIEKCKPINVVRSVVYNKESSQVIDQIGLELLPKDGKMLPIYLEFYNVGNPFIFNTQLQLQAKWNRLISAHLAEHAKVSTGASSRE